MISDENDTLSLCACMEGFGKSCHMCKTADVYPSLCGGLVVWSGAHGLLIWLIAEPSDSGGYLNSLPTHPLICATSDLPKVGKKLTQKPANPTDC